MTDVGFNWFKHKRATSKRATSSPQSSKRRRRLGIMALEPRIMYDGAAAATAAAAHHHHHDGGPVDPQTGAAAGAAGVSAPHPSGGDGHWHAATPSGEPMPQIATYVRNPTEIVFIDSQIPNYQALVTGAKPGVEVVVLDPNGDGVQQIANFLSRHRDPNLTNIDIVAHGAEGDLLLGSTNLTDGNLSADSAALAQIGAALKPGGGIMLYGCNVASGADGMQFIADLSQDAGGADVMAATHDIGMTADGPNWTLDASTGALVTDAPFTADAMANFAVQLGGEVKVNTTGGVSAGGGSSDDTSAEVAALPNGDYVVSWYTGSGARARLFDGSGTALGNDYAIPGIGSISAMSIAALPANAANRLPDGGYIVVYSNASGVFGEIFDVTTAGTVTQVGGAFQIGTGGSDFYTSVAVAANGSFMVTWDSGITAIDARLYNSSDVAAGGAFGVDPFQLIAVPPHLIAPTVAALSNGSFVIAYGGEVDPENTGFFNDVFADVYSSGGGNVSGNITVSSSSSTYLDTAVAGLSGGGFAMVWNDVNQNVVAQVFNNSGGSVSGQISVATESGGAIEPAVVGYTDGGFLVQWNGYNNGGYGSDIGAQRFSASGSTIGTAFQLDVPAETASSTGGASFQSPLAVLTNNQVVVAFTDNTDGSGADVFVNQFAMHSAPSGTNVTKTITENQSYTVAAADFGFSDPIDGDTLQGVEITTLPTSGTLKDNGAAVTAGEIVAIADINAGELVFTPATNSSGNSDSHFTFQVEDSGGNTGPNVNLDQSANTFTFNVTPLLPVVTAGASATFVGGGSAVALDDGLTVTDPGSTTLVSATVSIGTGHVTGDTLNFTNQNGITGSYSSTSGILTLTGSSLVGNYQTALDSITFGFSPSSSDPTNGGSHTSRTIDWVVSDSNAASNVAVTSTVGVFHAPPTLTAGAVAAFTQGGSAVKLDTSVALTAPDSGGDFSSATVNVAGGVFTTDGDTLAAVITGTSITASYAQATETLTLSGVDTLAHYQQVLDSVTFSSTGAVAGSRTIDWAINDGVKSSATSTSTVSVQDVPIFSAGATATFTGGGAAVKLDAGLTVTDIVSTTLASATVSIGTGFVTGDTLNFTNVAADGNIAVSSNSNGVLVLTSANPTATLAQWDAALDSITYSFSPANGDPTDGESHTSRTIDWVANDGTSSSSTATSTLTTVHVAPVISAGGTVTFTGGGPAVVLDSGVTLTDIDSQGLTLSAVVSVGYTVGDTLSFTSQNGVIGNFRPDQENLILSTAAGDANAFADMQAALQSITFSDGANDPTLGGSRPDVSITWIISDADGRLDQGSSTLDLVHAAPTVTASGAVVYIQDGSNVTLDSGLTLTAPDSNGNISSATVSVAGGVFADGDILEEVTAGTNITAQYVETHEILTLSGVDTVAHYQQVLDSLTFGWPGSVPGTRTIDWTVNDGVATSATATSTVTVHDLPTVSAGATATFTGGGTAVTLDGGLQFGDASSASLVSATVSISTGFISGDTLNFTNVAADGNIAIASNANGTLVLSSSDGSATRAQWDAALDSVTYSFIGTDPLSQTDGDPTGGAGAETTRTISYVVNDGVASSNAATSTLDTVHLAPTVTAGATAAYGGGGPPVALDSTLTVDDVDSSGNLVGATVQIVGFFNLDTLNFTNTAHITGSYDTFTGVLSLSGTDTVADYQAALRSVTYSFLGNGDPTVGGAHTQSSIYWVVNDGNTVNGTNEISAPPSVTLNNDQPSLGLNQIVVESGLFPSRGSPGSDEGGIPEASIRTFAGFGLNPNANMAEGQLLPINGNAALFSIIGSNYGGNGTTNFGVPNLEDTLTAGYEGSGNGLGERYGSNNLTLTHLNVPQRWGGNGTPFNNDQPTQTVNYIINTGGTSPVAGGDDSIGTVVAFLGNFAPNGYMEANGQVLNIAQNPGLFAVLGNTYGGNGVTTFALPDLDGRTIIGAGTDQNTGITIAIGATSGQDSTSLTVPNLPAPQGSSAPISNDQPSLALTYLVATTGLDSDSTTTSLVAGQAYAGEVIAFAGDGVALNNMLKAGWAVADGQVLSVNSSNFALYNQLGGLYGGDGTSTFAVPDLVGRSIAGINNSFGGVTLAEQFGSDTVSIPGSDHLVPTVATSTLNIVHEVPVVVPSGAVATFTGGGSAVPLDGGLTVSDVDSGGNLAGATVSIGSFLSGDSLNFADQNGITGSYDSTHGVLTLSGTTTLANYQAALDSISYSFLGTDPLSTTDGDPTGGALNDTTRTISYVVNDGVSSSAAVTSTLDTVHVAPDVKAGATATFIGGGAAVTLDSGLTVSDVDSNGNLAGATVSIGSFLSGDSLNFADQNGITGSYDSTHGVLTLSGTTTLANYQAALDSISYSFLGTDPLSTTDGDPTGGALNDTARTISFVVSDGAVPNGSSAAVTSTVDMVHVAPDVKAGATATFIGGGAAVTLDGALTVSDVDSNGNLSGATVSIGSFLSGDSLNFADQNGITGSYDSTHGVLTLSGTTTVGNYQAALDSISYSFIGADPLSTTDGDPTGGAANDTSRTISFVVSDGAMTNGSSAAVTSTVDTVHVAPDVKAGATATFTGGGAAVTLDGALAVSDVDSNGNLTGATVSIGSFLSGDSLNFADQNGITGSYDSAHGVLILSGTTTLANYQAALDSISYSFIGTDPLSKTDGDPTGGGIDTTRTISFVVSDGAVPNGSSTAVTSTLDTVHVAPEVTPSGLIATFTGGGGAVRLDGTLAVSDVDSNGNLAGATVAIGAGFISGDTLSFTNQNGITGSYDAVHGVLTLGGTTTLANYQAALDSITFSFTAASLDPTAGGGDTARSISWSVNDGVANSAAATSTLDAVHVPPTVTAGNSLSFDANGLQPITLDPAIILHDADKTTLAGAQIAITDGFAGADDVLGFTGRNGITGNYDGATGVLTLSGVASVADYQSALASVTFFSTTLVNAPRTVQWTVDDGNTNHNISLPSQTALKVEGLIIRANGQPIPVLPPAVNVLPAALVVPSSLTGPLAPPSGVDGFAASHGDFGYTVVHTDVALNTASDATFQIDVALAALEAPLGGDVAFVTARLANGDPLPDWLKFDSTAGTFAGMPPDGMFASLAPDQSTDSNIVTGTLPPDSNLGNGGAAAPAGATQTFNVEVLAWDSRGNVAVTIFTIDLRTHFAKHGWNIDRSLQPFGFEGHAGTTSLHDAAHPFEHFAAHVTPVHHHGDAGAAGHIEALPSGRAGLTEQMAAIGWRSMHAQRNALLASLQDR